MTKEEFEKLSEELKMDICREIAYEYAIFVPKDEPRAISKFKSIVCRSDKKFFEDDVLQNAEDRQIFPYDVIMAKIEKLVENYYREFKLGANARNALSNYGERGEKFKTYFEDCLKSSENTTKEAVQEELFRRLLGENDAKTAIKRVGDVVSRRTTSLEKLLESLAGQMEQFMILWEYQDKGYTRYRINATGDSCEDCQAINGKILKIADADIGENLAPLHPNCDCTIEILDEEENVVYTSAKTGQDKQSFGKYLQSSLKQLFLGNYTDDVTLFGTVLQVLAGLAGVDLPLDIRDLFYDVTNFELNKQHIVQTILDTVALLPLVGGIKYVDEAGDILKPAAKHSDEVAQVVKNTKKVDKISNIADNLKNISKKYKLTESGYFGKPGRGRTFTRNISSKNPETTAKDFYETISQGGIEYSHAKGKYAKMADGTIVAYRKISSSDGTSVVEINVHYSSNSGGLKNQKIHFIRED